jgi:chemotaxis response regulator CheB
VGIVASAGGIPALIELLGLLPRDFALPVIVAQHLPRGRSILPTILSWRSALHFSWAVTGEQPSPGCAYFVPPGISLRVSAAGFLLSPLDAPASSWLACGDHLITSLAALYGARTAAIVLSGMLPAGIEGLRAVKACGGITMAQKETSASYFDMPRAAIDFGKADFVTSPARMAAALTVAAEHWTGRRFL